MSDVLLSKNKELLIEALEKNEMNEIVKQFKAQDCIEILNYAVKLKLIANKDKSELFSIAKFLHLEKTLNSAQLIFCEKFYKIVLNNCYIDNFNLEKYLNKEENTEKQEMYDEEKIEIEEPKKDNEISIMEEFKDILF